MSNELTITGSMSFSKAGVTPGPIGSSVTNQLLSVSGSTYIQESVSVGISSFVALGLGGVTSPGAAQFFNADTTNYIQIQNGSGGSPFLRIPPNTLTPYIPLDPGCVPYAKANTAACILNYTVIST